MNTIYYTEINLICIIILLLFKCQLHEKSKSFSTVSVVFNLLIQATILFCVSDMVAGSLRGQFFWGAAPILEVSNLIYFEALAIISYLWMLYVFLKLNSTPVFSKKRLFLWSIPLLIFSLIALSNPFTHLLFFIDENHLYVRSNSIYLHWLVTWFYLLLPTVQTASVIAHEPNKIRRRELTPLLYFIIAPIIACTIQMLCYGVSSSQVGITISIVMIFLVMQSNQVLTDALTGLNNRRGFDHHLSSHILHQPNALLALFMIDLDDFKQVNDRFGHTMGDLALQDAADVLRQACKDLSQRLFLCRYGGDEFLIVGTNCSPAEIALLQKQIHQELANKAKQHPFALTVSIGVATGMCSTTEDLEHLLREADKAMYREKRSK